MKSLHASISREKLTHLRVKDTVTFRLVNSGHCSGIIERCLQTKTASPLILSNEPIYKMR